MNSIYKKVIQKPILLLLAFNVIIGLFVYRDFGLTWDEPFFYGYADALGYAYSPVEWFSGDFDLYNSYGPSAEDHKTRGPAYLLLARNFVYGLRALGSNNDSAWHLINFLFFQLGVYFLYRTARRWMGRPAALFASAFFSLQPLLLGHAFINPKDPPFLTFFLASVCLGFEMVDSIMEARSDKTKKLLLAAIALGIATSIRILAPLTGLLVFIYFMARAKESNKPPAWWPLIQYGLIAFSVMFLTWPFLWESVLTNFINVFLLMSDNPTNLSVLFNGSVYSASELPRRYLPVILAITLTEPTWLLFGIGFVYGYRELIRNRGSNFKKRIVSLTLVLSYFLIVLAYVLLRRPAMYDGMRHFFFILPPIFIFIGFAYEFLIEKLSSLSRASNKWLHAALGLILVLPGIIGIIKLHPYEYTYYNTFVGSTDGAFRKYETDYWLTCYKEAVEKLNRKAAPQTNLFVYREAYIAAAYANENIDVHDLRAKPGDVSGGDYILVNSRTNEDLGVSVNSPVVMEIKKDRAIFCVLKQAP